MPVLGQVRYAVRGARSEEWLHLEKSRFMWLTELPPGTAANPTFSSTHTPQRSAALSQRVGRWALAIGTLKITQQC